MAITCKLGGMQMVVIELVYHKMADWCILMEYIWKAEMSYFNMHRYEKAEERHQTAMQVYTKLMDERQTSS